MDRWMDGQMDRQINSISFHSTELCPLLGLLPCYPERLLSKKIQGTEITDLNWFLPQFWVLMYFSSSRFLGSHLHIVVQCWSVHGIYYV